jgi:amino acid permease
MYTIRISDDNNIININALETSLIFTYLEKERKKYINLYNYEWRIYLLIILFKYLLYIIAVILTITLFYIFIYHRQIVDILSGFSTYIICMTCIYILIKHLFFMKIVKLKKERIMQLNKKIRTLDINNNRDVNINYNYANYK